MFSWVYQQLAKYVFIFLSACKYVLLLLLLPWVTGKSFFHLSYNLCRVLSSLGHQYVVLGQLINALKKPWHACEEK